LIGIGNGLGLVEPNLQLEWWGIMCEPAIGNNQIISSCIATTKIKLSHPTIKHSWPYHSRIL